jgi:hypothetical protein
LKKSAPARRSGAHRIALLAAAAMTIVACADLLDASNHNDVVEELCGGVCKSSLPDCKKKLTTGLATAKDSDVADWLQSYVDLDCRRADCATTALECFYTAPGVCTPVGQACTTSAECCKFDFEDARKGSGCCGAGGGTCCDTCLTCAEAVGLQMPDVNTVCLSHRPALEAVVNCRNTTCKVACTTKVACDACVAEKCKAQAKACNEKQAP